MVSPVCLWLYVQYITDSVQIHHYLGLILDEVHILLIHEGSTTRAKNNTQISKTNAAIELIHTR